MTKSKITTTLGKHTHILDVDTVRTKGSSVEVHVFLAKKRKGEVRQEVVFRLDIGENGQTIASIEECV
jgi:hypothetical protein